MPKKLKKKDADEATDDKVTPESEEETEETEDEDSDAEDSEDASADADASDSDEDDEEEDEDEDEEEETTEKTVRFDPAVKKTVESMIAKAVKKQGGGATIKVAQLEKVIRKGIGAAGSGGRKISSGADAIAKESKEVRLVKQLKARIDGDSATYQKYRKAAIASLVKAGYQNEGTDADGGYLVPDADFVTEVGNLLDDYGVARKNFRIWKTKSDSVRMPKIASGITLYELGEGEVKTGSKVSFGQDLVTLRKFAAIATLTDELTEDAAVNIYNILVEEFARAAAQVEDQLAFTDPTTGILNVAGVHTVSVGTNITDLDFDDLNTGIYKVPAKAMKGGKFFLHRTLLGVLQRIKDQEDNYIWKPGPNGVVDGTIWGFPYELVEVMPEVGDNAADSPFLAFGNPRYGWLIEKAPLALKQLTEATVHDAEGEAVNLAEQDMTALRGVIRRNFRLQFPTSFVVFGTGTVS